MRPEEFLPPEEYAKVRDAELDRIVEHKKRRRVDYGDRLSFLFEDERTVRHQIQEVIFMDSIVDRKVVEELIATYEPMVPGDDEISLTAFYLVYNEEELEEFNAKMAGWESRLRLLLGDDELGGRPIYDDYDPRRPKTVAYLKFKVPQALLERPVSIKLDHPSLSVVVQTPFKARELVGGASIH